MWLTFGPRRLGALALTALVVTGCGGGGGGGGKDGAASGGGAHADRPTILMVSGPLVDPFFSAIKKGGDAAAKDLGVKFEYLAPKDLSNPGPDLARIEESALARKPDAILVSEFLPDAQDPPIQRMVKQGIPVVAVNAGVNWQKLGALNFIGEDPNKVGQAAGGAMAKAGVRHGLCVNHVPGNPTLEARCTGFSRALSQAGGKATVLTIPVDQATNPTAVKSAVQGALRANSSIDGVFTLGSGVAENAIDAVQAAGKDGKVTVGTTDLSKKVLADVQSGKLAFAIDQQPYLQSYLGVVVAAQWLRTGLHPIGQVATAPLLITKDNVAGAIKSNNASGIRGAA